jgi:hypothetical protein
MVIRCGLTHEDLWFEQILKFDAEDIFELPSCHDQQHTFDYIFELRKQSVLQEGEEAEESGPGSK